MINKIKSFGENIINQAKINLTSINPETGKQYNDLAPMLFEIIDNDTHSDYIRIDEGMSYRVSEVETSEEDFVSQIQELLNKKAKENVALMFLRLSDKEEPDNGTVFKCSSIVLSIYSTEGAYIHTVDLYEKDNGDLRPYADDWKLEKDFDTSIKNPYEKD